MTEPAIDRIRVVDFETTGLEPTDKIVEAAFCDVVCDEGRWLRGGSWTSLVDPGCPIPAVAMAVHHITDEDVKGAPSLAEVLPHLGMLDADQGNATPVYVFAAHRANFEQQFYKPADARWICTWKVAVTIWRDAPGYSNQILRYWLGLKLRPEMCARPHRAPDDAYVTAAILVRMLNANPTLTIDEMVEISSHPVVLPFLTFGMHAMKSFETYTDGPDGREYTVPSSYLEWMLRQKDMDVDARCTAFHHLNARRLG